MVSESLLLEQNGQHLSVSNDVVQRLGDLVGRRLVTHDDPQHGTEVRKETVSLLRAADGRRLPNSGLFPALRFLAQRGGIRLQRRVTPAIRTLPDPIHLEFLSYPQVAQFAFHTPLGRIAIHPGIKPEDVIGDLASAFPDTRIVVLGGHARQLKRIAEALCARKIRAWSITTRFLLPLLDHLEDEEIPRVICSTPREAANIDFATAGIVILLDASACQHADMQMTLSQVDAAFRLYGLFDVTRVPAPSVVDATMATFGPDIIRLQSRLEVRREVHVAWMPTPPPEIDLDLKDPNFGRRCYWHHERRNRRIKQLAKGLRSASPLNRRSFGEVERRFGQPGYTPPSVTILVDRPIHAVELSRLLPDWPVIAADESLEGLDANFCDGVRQQRREWLDGSHQIVLTSAAPRFRGETSDVVIWVGGGKSLDAIPRRWLSAAVGSSNPILIIDFLDGHNQVAKSLSRDRRREYLQNDIFPIDISAAQGRLAMFLNRQPEAHQ